jgi:MFS family permease
VVVNTDLFHRDRSAQEPLLPMEILKNPIVLGATGAVFFAMAANFGLGVYVPIYFEGVRNMASTGAGLSLVPLMLSTVVGAAFSGFLTTRIKAYKRPAIVGLAVGVVSLLSLAIAAPYLNYFQFETILALTGAGVGTLFPLVTVCVQNAVLLEHLGVATSALTFLRSLGAAMGVSVVGAVFLSFGFGSVTDQGKTLRNLGEPGISAFSAIFFTAAICLIISEILLLMVEEKPLRASSVEDAPVAVTVE